MLRRGGFRDFEKGRVPEKRGYMAIICSFLPEICAKLTNFPTKVEKDGLGAPSQTPRLPTKYYTICIC